jgi:aspartate racemase
LLINEYGPTETAVGCCTYRIPANGPRSGPVPIGRPIANTRLYVLDLNLRPVAPGQPGELYVGGAGLARGYHQRPDLTADRFVPDPFGGESGARLYRTGDLVRALPEGDLEFLGRIDRQVKVRGVRIEVEEIEAVLAEHPAVRTTTVLAREDTRGERHLVAYVVPHRGRSFDAADMRDHLKGWLPEHLVPSALVQLDNLPLSLNGKVDVEALPAPDRSHLKLTGFVSARTALEIQMVRLWEMVLGIQPIGVRDDFFGLGGDSLLAVGLFAEIHKVFGRNLSMASLLQSPTVERLVKLLERPAVADAEPALVPLQPHGSRPPFFCVHAIGGDALGYRDLARYLGLDQPFCGLRSRWSGNERRPASLQAMAAEYLDEIRAYQPHGPYYLGGFSFGGTVAFEMAQQLQAQREAVALLAIIDQRSNPGQARAPFRPSFLLEFLKNLPRWVWYDLCQTSPTAMLKRLRLRLKAMLTLPARWRHRRGDAPSAAARKLGATFDLARLPESYRNLLEYHFQLVLDYRPRAYAGRVTLLRASAQPLSRLQAADLGWSQLAGGGVEVIHVPSSHETLFAEPHVRVLAERLRACLHKDQPARTPRLPSPSGPSAAPTGELAATDAMLSSDEKPLLWKVVVNREGQYSLWPLDRAEPLGWADVDRSGTRDECLAYIKGVWQDLRPLSLRNGQAL